MIFPVESNRLILRPFEERDIAPFADYRSDSQVARYQGWDAPYPLEKAADFVHEMMGKTPGEAGQWYQAALELKSSGEMIGDCAFRRAAEDPRQAEIGLTLARSFQGKGYASEATRCLLNYLFRSYDLHRVFANVDPANQPSIRVLERVGMRFEGRFVESLWLKGAWVDEAWYAILRREWQG